MSLVQLNDSYFERLGGDTSPPDTTHFTEGVARDPVQDKLLAMAKVVLNYDLGGSTSTVTADSLWSSVRSEIRSLSSKQPVERTKAFLATPQTMAEEKHGLPVLFLDRTGTQQFVEVTVDDRHLVSEWLLLWLLGPLSTGEAQRTRALCTKIVPMLIQRMCRHRCHPKYSSGAVQFHSDADELLELEVTAYSADPVPLPDQALETSPYYYGVGMTLRTTERVKMIDGLLQEMLPGSYHLNVGGLDGTVKDMIIAEN